MANYALLIRTVEYISPAADHLEELLKAVPLVVNIELISVAPDIKELRLVRLKREELLAEAEHLVHFPMVVHGGIKEEKVIRLKVEAVS